MVIALAAVLPVRPVPQMTIGALFLHEWAKGLLTPGRGALDGKRARQVD